MSKLEWIERVGRYLNDQLQDGLAPSVPGKSPTLYGAVYSVSARYYLGLDAEPIAGKTLRDFLLNCQDPATGLLVGPELDSGVLARDGEHDLEHLRLHSTCSALPFYQLLGIKLEPITYAHRFCDLDYLEKWETARDWNNAWLEGNNILFIGQLLLHLRDVERYPGAADALEHWFHWLESEVDPDTSLWGTNGYCSKADAVYGGYHQLLLYWHENRPIPNPEGLVDTVLGLRHPDGGFNPKGNAGACEDVDSVDILVHCYKRWAYRRAEIRCALWACVDHILATQNADGGFPYNLNRPQSHMGIPGTEAGRNESCAFPTWFRIHTLALCAEVIPGHPALAGQAFHYNPTLSMGWHASPEGWKLLVPDAQLEEEQMIAKRFSRGKQSFQIKNKLLGPRSFYGRAKRRIRSLTR